MKTKKHKPGTHKTVLDIKIQSRELELEQIQLEHIKRLIPVLPLLILILREEVENENTYNC